MKYINDIMDHITAEIQMVVNIKMIQKKSNRGQFLPQILQWHLVQDGGYHYCF